MLGVRTLDPHCTIFTDVNFFQVNSVLNLKERTQMLFVCKKEFVFLFYFIGDGMVETVRGQLFTVGPRYTNLQYIGEGAYGMVA